ncbi:hypothetical protein [Streptosporangium subroseum]|uniref:hypothetical protein n=1 Tax=Streptosporangium subroseum TaxID=106412 RepID=UPI0030864670|nr:hypothetical protein OHB15_06050 [Streptosporangium subroseum]
MTPESLLPGLTIIGIVSGATFAPLQQATMDGVGPRLARAASGVSPITACSSEKVS